MAHYWKPVSVGIMVAAVLVLESGSVCVAGPRGVREAEWINVHAADYEIVDAEPFYLEKGVVGAGDHPLRNVDLTTHLKFARYCATGTVADVRYECVHRRHGGAQSLAVVEIEVEKLHWGAAARYVVFETLVSRAECPVVYDYPKYRQFEIGDRFLIVGSSGRPVNYVRELGFLKIVEGEVRAVNGQVWGFAEVANVVSEHEMARAAQKATGRQTFKLKR